MATRRLQYSQEIEAQLAKGKTLEEAHNIAAEKSETTRKVKTTKKPSEKGLIERTKQRIAKLFGRKKTKKTVKPTAGEKQVVQKRLKEKYPQMAKTGWGKPRKATKRTKQVSGQLAKAGLTEAEIRKLHKR